MPVPRHPTMGAAEGGARELARQWTAHLEIALGELRTELSDLNYALSAQPSTAETVREEVVALARTLCASAAQLGKRYESLAAFVNEAPPLSHLLSAAEAKLDAADAALDATEAALGISPVVVATPAARSPSPDELISSLRNISIGERDPRGRRSPQASPIAARKPPPQQRNLGATTARVRRVANVTPLRTRVKEDSLPSTPTLADFGISDDALSGIYAPPLSLNSALPTLGASSPARTSSRAAAAAQPAWASRFEDTSPAQDDSDPGDETYDETVGRYMKDLGIEPPDVLRSRYGLDSSKANVSPPQLRGLDGNPLYSEETPRAQTRHLHSQSTVVDALKGIKK